MKNFQAVCEDHWQSRVAQADSADDAANTLHNEVVDHMKQVHDMEMPTDPVELHKMVLDHVKEV